MPKLMLLKKLKPLYSGKEKNKCKKIKNLKKLNMLVFRTNKKGEYLMNAKTMPKLFKLYE